MAPEDFFSQLISVYREFLSSILHLLLLIYPIITYVDPYS